MAIDVLLVDDLTFIRNVLRAILATAGFHVTGEATTGRQAIELYREARPDVVLMDITMPELDGLDALRAIREHDPQANVIMCSALGQERLMADAIAAGARDFVVKPFTPERIIAAVKIVLDIG
jgi:two-component system chemotaxis response regulator CheY